MAGAYLTAELGTMLGVAFVRVLPAKVRYACGKTGQSFSGIMRHLGADHAGGALGHEHHDGGPRARGGERARPQRDEIHACGAHLVKARSYFPNTYESAVRNCDIAKTGNADLDAAVPALSRRETARSSSMA